MCWRKGMAAHLDVSAAHVVFVSLQCHVSVLHVDEAHQSLTVPPALRIQTQSHSTPTANTHIHTMNVILLFWNGINHVWLSNPTRAISGVVMSEPHNNNIYSTVNLSQTHSLTPLCLSHTVQTRNCLAEILTKSKELPETHIQQQNRKAVIYVLYTHSNYVHCIPVTILNFQKI